MFYLIFCVLFSCALHAQESIEEIRDHIVATLAKHNPQVLEKFHELYKQFDSSVHSFFDRANKQSLAEHSKRMEQELALLTTVCKDKAFASVATILKVHRQSVIELIAIFKKYVGSYNSVAFALKVKRFEHLLPDDIKSRGHFSIFRSLHHRLLC